MPRLSHYTILATCLCLAAGCQTSLRNAAKATTGQLDAPNVPAREAAVASATQLAPPAAPVPSTAGSVVNSPTVSSQREPLVEPTREEAFQRVLADLQAIGQEDPVAQQRVLAQLESADPAHWAPLVARTRSTLSFQKQLAQSTQPFGVLPASSSQRSSSSQPAFELHRHDREARVIPLGDAPPSNAPESKPAPPAETDQQRRPETSDFRMYDPAVQTTAAMADTAAPTNPSPYPTTPHAELAFPGAGLLSSRMGGSASESAEDSLDLAINQLSQRLSDKPQSVSEAYDHVRLRLLQIAAGDLDAAATPPPGLTANEQQYWSNQILAIGTLLNHQSEPEARRRAAAGVLHLGRAKHALEQLGSLTVTNLVFCDEVYGFGAYEQLTSSKFRPGQEVKVYAEINNYKSVPTAQGLHTSLATSYQVLDQHGGRVEGGEVPVVNDYCATRRSDFHIQYGITLPRGIYPGRYVLQLTLTDQLGDKIGHGALDFEIAESE